jgi:hypothetical protein
MVFGQDLWVNLAVVASIVYMLQTCCTNCLACHDGTFSLAAWF